MNAHKVADDLQECIDDGSTDLVCVQEAAILIRQQADRIAELEKQSEPVAWVYETENVDGEPYLTDVSLKPLFGLVTRYGYKEIPLYTTPQTKPLSDEEIEYYEHLIAKLFNVSIQQKVIGLDRIIRAIEERHGIK